MSNPQQTAQELTMLLESAWEDIADIDHWCQHVSAQTEEGDACSYMSESATRFCAFGSLWQKLSPITGLAERLLEKCSLEICGTESLSTVNDHGETPRECHQKIGKIYREAIALSQQWSEEGIYPFEVKR